MRKWSWILFVLCLVVFVGLRLLAVRKESADESLKTKPVVPEPVLSRISHPWLMTQPKVPSNPEIKHDLSAFDELCEAVQRQGDGFTREQIERALITTLISLQKHIPFHFPEELYSVFCITETPLDWIKPPAPFHVYKRLYLDEMETGLPFYLDVRVFELDRVQREELVNWHLELLTGEPSLLHQDEKRVAYLVSGERKYETAHGFAKGERGLFIDCIEEDGRLYVLYAEAPINTFRKHESLFKRIYHE